MKNLIDLPIPNYTDPFLNLLRKRKSCRNFSDQTLDDTTISELMYSALGMVRIEKEMYTVPSARNIHNISIYLILKKGSYLYLPKNHKLELVTTENLMEASGTQEFVKNAALNLVFVAKDLKDPPLEDKSKLYLYEYEEIGHISQNIYLYCAYKNLATVVRGLFDHVLLKSSLKLEEDQRVLLTQTVGHFAPR